MSEVTLLAVTRMLSGVCIGGIAQDGRWIRPVKEHGTLLLGDITYPTREVMQALDVVEFPVLRPRPQPPHVEDCIADFIRARPRRSRHLSPEARASFLATHAEADANAVLRDHLRSLCLVRASRIEAEFARDDYSGKYDARLSVEGERALPVTDLRWRAVGRRLLGTGDGRRRFTQPELARALGCEVFYVAYGLSRSFEGKLWPLVVGVHPVPDFEVAVDYDDL